MIKFALVWLAVCGLVLGCGENGENECDKEAKIMKAGLDEGCEGRDDECWYCKCYNDGGKQVHTEPGPDGAVYSCVEPEIEPCVDDPETPDIDECGCEGKALADAEECLADEEKCRQRYIDMQDRGCENTLIP
jgi:hypothetical protein